MEHPMKDRMADMKQFLLVEDDAWDVELIMTALKDHCETNKTTVVDNGAEALDYLYRRGLFSTRSAGNPAFVLLDNKMPKVDGIDVLKAVKTDERLKTIPVILFTSSREASDLREFYRHGINAYVVKPVDVSEFLMVVRQLAIFWGTVNEPPLEYQMEKPAGPIKSGLLLKMV
jgi:CheY-like chemotaxis protein